MRIVTVIRILTLLAFALFGGALPVAASGDHVVICGADGVKRVVAYDFDAGQPVETDSAEAECQDCFGAAPLLMAAAGAPNRAKATLTYSPVEPDQTRQARPSGLPPARAPPSLIL